MGCARLCSQYVATLQVRGLHEGFLGAWRRHPFMTANARVKATGNARYAMVAIAWGCTVIEIYGNNGSSMPQCSAVEIQHIKMHQQPHPSAM